MALAWGITGCGHLLQETAQELTQIPAVDLFLSRAAEEVLPMYGLDPDQLVGHRGQVFRDRSASSPVVGRFYRGQYQALVVSPASSNSVAKFVCGISDNLITNLFAQALKCKLPVLVLPADTDSETVSPTPRQDLITVYPRPVDLDNTRQLADMPGVTVVQDVEALHTCLAAYS